MSVRRVLMTADTVGGVWTYALELARALGHAGVETILATMGPAPAPAQCSEAAAIPSLRLRESTFKLEWMEEPWSDVQRAGEWLLSIERACRPDVVHLNGYAHGSLRWRSPVLMAGHSCVLSWWNAVYGCQAPHAWNTYRDAVRRGLRGADLVVTPSRAMLASLERLYGALANARAIPNGRTSQIFSPQPKEPYLMIAGRLWDHAKNLAAARRVSAGIDWPIYGAGDGEPIEGVHSLGKLCTRDLAEWLGRASIYLSPARYEPFGLSVLEAALSGCALVLSDLPSFRENWDGAAEFVPLDDDAALLASLNRLIASEAERAALQAAAQARARRFTPQAMAAAYLACYRSLETMQPTLPGRLASTQAQHPG